MKIAAVVGGVLLVLLGGIAYWLGAFGKVTVSEQAMGPYPFVYVQEASSAAAKVDAITRALAEVLDAAGISERKPARLYYPTGRGIQNQIGFVVDRAVTQDKLGIDNFFRNIPEQRYAVARFPFRNALSLVVAGWRVEGPLASYRKAKGLAEASTMVILDGDTILYLQPVNQGG